MMKAVKRYRIERENGESDMASARYAETATVKRKMRKKRTTEQSARELFLFLAICACYFAVQASTLSNPAYETIESWRQTDTYSIAVNYVQYDMNPFAPQFNYDGIGNIYVQLELQIVPYLSALLFRLLGGATPVVPRLLSLLFYLGSAWFFFRILRRFTVLWTALMGLLLYLFLPISMVFSRAIMPEACAMFFYCGAVWFLLDWYQSKRRATYKLWLSAICMAFAILEKIPVAFAGLLVLACFVWKWGRACLHEKSFWGYGAVSLGLPLLYYAYVSVIATAKFVGGIASKHIFTEGLSAVFTSEAMDFFRTELPKAFCPAILLCACIGFFLCRTQRRKPLAVWAVAFALELGVIVAVIRFGYYLIFVAPVLAALCAVFLEEVGRKKPMACIACFLVLFCLELFQSIPCWSDATQLDTEIASVAQSMEAISEQSDLFAVASGSPVYLNAANRHGYRANIGYYEEIPTGAQAETAYYIARGVSYFVVVGDSVCNDESGEYLAYLNQTFPVALENEYCKIYDLRREDP